VSVEGIDGTIDGASQDGFTVSHGFKEDDAKALARAGHNKSVTGIIGEGALVIGQRAEEVNAWSELAIGCFFSECDQIDAVANDGVMDMGGGGPKSLKGGEDFPMAFVTVVTQAGHSEDKNGVKSEAKATAGVVLWGEVCRDGFHMIWQQITTVG